MLKPFKLSNSKANTWRRCPKKFEFAYVKELEPKRKGLPLHRGDWLHQLLMTHYDGEDWHVLQKKLTQEFDKLFDEEKEEYGDLPFQTKRIFTSYLQHYKQEDAGLRVVDSEIDEEVTLPNGNTFHFIIDLLIEETDGGLWLWDHKTVKEFMPQDFMLIDSQLARYFWAAEKFGIGPVRGVMFNELITKPPTLPKLTPKTGELERRSNIVCDFYSYLAEVKRQGFDPKDYREILLHLKRQTDRWFRRTPLPRDKALTKRMMQELLWTAEEMQHAIDTQQFSRTAQKSCTWDCEFLNLCVTELMGGDISDIVKLQFQKKTPRKKGQE